MTNTSKIIKDYVFIFAGAFLLAVGVNFFLVPMRVSTGGVSGIGTVLYYMLSVPMSVTTLALNAVLFLIGFKTLPRASVIKTAFGIVSLSYFLEVTKSLGEYTEDIFIASVFGGVLIGLGIGLTVLKNASTGGSDFAAVMLNRVFPHISVPAFILIIDAVVILVSGIIFRDYTVMFYSVISLSICSKVADMVLVSGDYAKSVLIISKYSDIIAKNILTTMDRGVTGIYSKGFYNGDDRIMLMCIVRSKEIPRLMSLVRNADTDAFTVVTDVRKVHGKGFRREL